MNCKLLSAAVALAAAFAAAAGEHTAYVNTFIGTGAMDGGLSGNCYPGATVPFGMVQLCPDTHPSPDWYNAGGYLYTDSIIYGFSHTRLSGTGAADLIDVSLFPSVSRATSSGFSHAEESAGPGYYKVRLADEDITAELTATPRTGIHRYSFPKNAQRNILIDLDHSCQKGSWDRKIIQSQLRRTGPNTIEGYRVITGWAKLRKVYFIAEFSEPIASLEISDGGQKRGGATVVNGRDLKAWLGFGNAGRPLTVRVALSGVSNENARENLRKEAPKAGFRHYREAADAEWERRLGAIDVKGDSAAMVTFYTAMYHTMIQPNAFSDVNGEYTTPVYTTRKVGEGETQYTTFSLWDTYRAAHPLYTLICPGVNAQFVNSLIRHYDDYGYLPVWHLWGQDNYCMIGNHSVPVIAEAIVNGVEGIDEEKAYAAVRNSLTQSHPNSPFDVWEHYGYMPEPLQTQSVSITLEQAFDDWCAARLAERLGHEEDLNRFAKRSQYYANLFDPKTGFFRARDEKGNFMEPFDPLKHGANGGNPYTEGNAWQYCWYVPHDVDGLVALMGGKKAFEAKLDEFFSLDAESGERNSNVSGLIGQYAHGNEPSHHVAYLYNDAGAPRKCQALVARIMREMYNNSPSGYAGNDDCGEMSAWYIFSAMGFYPVNPASGEYYLGTPLFDSCTLNLENGRKFTVTASRRTPGSYGVKSVKLNGKPLKSTRLRHSDIVAGGTLEFIMD